jgi:hypothetical protein
MKTGSRYVGKQVAAQEALAHRTRVIGTGVFVDVHGFTHDVPFPYVAAELLPYHKSGIETALVEPLTGREKLELFYLLYAYLQWCQDTCRDNCRTLWPGLEAAITDLNIDMVATTGQVMRLLDRGAMVIFRIGASLVKDVKYPARFSLHDYCDSNGVYTVIGQRRHAFDVVRQVCYPCKAMAPPEVQAACAAIASGADAERVMETFRLSAVLLKYTEAKLVRLMRKIFHEAVDSASHRFPTNRGPRACGDC